MGFLFRIFRFFAFRVDPERIHHLTLFLFSLFPRGLSWIFGQYRHDPKYALKVGGLVWPFPVGLAAGLDKNAVAVDFFSRLLFGAIEVGTITPLPQGGNPKVRLFRYPHLRSLRNQMGFNNEGMEKVGRNICPLKRRKILGINLGKNKSTPKEKAPEDYRKLYEYFAPLGDYLVINVSSPNTPGLQELQGQLEDILASLEEARRQNPCPLFVKISPDLPEESLVSIVEVAKNYRLTGLIASNTAVMEDFGPGGMSGEILREKARTTRRKLLRLVEGRGLEVIGVGGIASFEDILEFWREGGKVVQIYTSFIYHGPSLLKDIKDRIDELLEKEGVDSLEELLSRPR